MHMSIHKIAQLMFALLPRRLNGFVVRCAKDHIPAAVRAELGLLDMEWSIRNVCENGWLPGGIIDVGACRGRWSEMIRRIIPDAPILLIEGNPACEDDLVAVAARLGKCRARVALLGSHDKETVLFHQMGEGSSVLSELSEAPREPIALPMHRLDAMLDADFLTPPYFLKLDVQGYELQVLQGAQETLAQSDMVLLETSLIPYNDNAPLFADIIATMKQSGFVPYDLCGTRRRMSDQALFQTDVLFVRENSQLRTAKPFYLS